MQTANKIQQKQDVLLAQYYKKMHPVYDKENIHIIEVWRDDSGTLCVRYATDKGREIGWFHYLYENGQLTWW